MKNKSTDLFGIAPYGETIKLAVEKSLDGIGSILSKLCMPAAEEFGLMFKDQVRKKRLNNFIKIIEKSDGRFNLKGDLSDLSIHPRILKELIDSGSWCEDEVLQDMWSGLLVSSIENQNAKGKNVLFLDAIKKLTSIQARIVQYVCKNCKVIIYENCLILSAYVTLEHSMLVSITGETDITHLDAEIDNLRANDLIAGGYQLNDIPAIAKILPSAFLLQLYAKTQGYHGLLSDFYKDQIAAKDDPDFIRPKFLTT